MRHRHGPINTIVKELIIGFGFLNGLWLAIGINPEALLIKVLNNYSVSMPVTLQNLLIYLPILFMIITIVTLIKIYHSGGIIGSLAVLVAFIAGSIILTNWKASIIILIVAIIMGLLSFKKRT